MPVLVLNSGQPSAITVTVQSAEENEPTDIGGSERAFAGNLRVGTRAQKRQWNATTTLLDTTSRDAILALIANNVPLPCAGDLLGATITCSVKRTGQRRTAGTDAALWVVGLRVTEV